MMKKTQEERIESLKKQQDEIKAKIAKLEAQRSTQERKDDTRLKVLIGAALLADAKANSSTSGVIRSILRRAVTTPRDKEFLAAKGWMASENPSPN